MSSKKASLLSLGVCLPAQPCLSTQASLLPSHLQLQLYALGWPKSGPAPQLPAPPPHSYHQGQQCLEREDWEMAVLYFSRALHLNSQLVSGGHGRLLTHTLPSPLNLPGPFSRSLLVTEHQASVDGGEGTQPGSSLPQVDFYALRAEAYIQLCDFSSAALNLRRAYSFQPENTKCLERLTFVLYLQVPGAAAGPPRAPASHPSLLALPSAVGVFVAPGTSSASLGTFLSHLYLLPLSWPLPPPELVKVFRNIAQ